MNRTGSFRSVRWAGRAAERLLVPLFLALAFAVGMGAFRCHRAPESGTLRSYSNPQRSPVLPSVIRSFIVSDFDGIKMGNIYRLANGQIWEQSEPYIWIHIAVIPPVTIWSSHGMYKMKVDGIDRAVGVRLVYGPDLAPAVSSTDSEALLPAVIESQIVSDFDGFEMGNIYKLANGQIWEQTDPRFRARIRVNPGVTIWKDGSQYSMHVDGLDPAITVRPLTDIRGAESKRTPVSHPAAPAPNDVLQSTLASGRARVIADDGTFLGSVENQFGVDSIANEFGTYGSKFSAKSILNEFGKYGGKFSMLSPYNSFSSAPPAIYLDGERLMYVTTNETITPRVHPDVLVGILRAP